MLHKFRICVCFIFLLGMALMCVLGSSSSGGDDEQDTGTETSDGTDTGDSGSSDTAFKNFVPSLSAGDYWEFYWTVDDTTYIQGSGTSNEVTTGNFKVELGAAENIGGTAAYPLTITGTETDGAVKFAPRWKYIAANSNQLLGSQNGSTFQVIFDGNTGTWSGGGFFTEVPDSTAMTASSSSIDNEYVSTSGVSVGRTISDGGCEYYYEIGQSLCDDEEYSYSETEYYKSGIGPLGYFVRYSYSKTDLTISFTIKKEVGLVDTSFESDDGFDPEYPPWRELPDMPTARHSASASAYNDIIYVSGGRSGTITVNKMESYNPFTGIWTTLASMPGGKYMHTSAALGDRIYVFGGYGDDKNAVYAYDPGTDSWEETGTLSVEDEYLKSVVIGDTIHVVVETENYYSVSASGNSLLWTNGSDLPAEHHGFGLAAVGTDIFVIGNTYGSHYGTTRKYDTASSTWTTVSSMPTGRRDMAVGTVDNSFYVIGGYVWGDDSRVNEAFNATTGTWTEKSSMPTAREEMAYAVVNGKIYVIGGMTDNVSLKTLEVYNPAVD